MMVARLSDAAGFVYKRLLGPALVPTWHYSQSNKAEILYALLLVALPDQVRLTHTHTHTHTQPRT